MIVRPVTTHESAAPRGADPRHYHCLVTTAETKRAKECPFHPSAELGLHVQSWPTQEAESRYALEIQLGPASMDIKLTREELDVVIAALTEHRCKFDELMAKPMEHDDARDALVKVVL